MSLLHDPKHTTPTQNNSRQQTIIYDLHRRVVGYISKYGFIYDHDSTLLGYVSQQGIVRDVALHQCGLVDMETETFPFAAGKIAFSLLSRPK